MWTVVQEFNLVYMSEKSVLRNRTNLNEALVYTENSYNMGQDSKNSFCSSEINQRQGFYKLHFLVHIKK